MSFFFRLYRYRETDSKASNWNWIELPVNPPEARKVKIHNLTPRTKYEFQVIGENEFGDGMYSEIIEAQTKGKYRPNFSKLMLFHLVQLSFSGKYFVEIHILYLLLTKDKIHIIICLVHFKLS